MTELKIERHLTADPDTVFAFVTQSEHLLKWWGPEGVTIAEGRLDFTTTGPWSSVMVNAEGTRYKVTGEVLKVEAPNAIELSWGWHDENDQRGHESHVRFEVDGDGKGGSVFRLIHSGLADDDSAANHDVGWTSSLVKLERMAS